MHAVNFGRLDFNKKCSNNQNSCLEAEDSTLTLDLNFDSLQFLPKNAHVCRSKVINNGFLVDKSADRENLLTVLLNTAHNLTGKANFYYSN